MKMKEQDREFYRWPQSQQQGKATVSCDGDLDWMRQSLLGRIGGAAPWNVIQEPERISRQ